jgi:hypothetical protein
MFWVAERYNKNKLSPKGRIYDEMFNLIRNPEATFGTYPEALWVTFISFFGVGYGEVYPETEAGRLVAILCNFYGCTTTSLMIVNLMNILFPTIVNISNIRE